MTETAATGYDGLSSRLVSPAELRRFLLDCFVLGERELFVGHADRVGEQLRDVPADVRFAAFCTYAPASGDFAMRLDVGIEGHLVDRVGRREFFTRFAAHFDAYVLYGDNEPPWIWTVILPDGDRLWVTEAEHDESAPDDSMRLASATETVYRGHTDPTQYRQAKARLIEVMAGLGISR